MQFMILSVVVDGQTEISFDITAYVVEKYFLAAL